MNIYITTSSIRVLDNAHREYSYRGSLLGTYAIITVNLESGHILWKENRDWKPCFIIVGE